MTSLNGISDTVLNVEGSVQRLLNVIVLIIGALTFSLIVDALYTISGIILSHIAQKRMKKLEKLEKKLIKKIETRKKEYEKKKKAVEPIKDTSESSVKDSSSKKMKKHEEGNSERGKSCEIIMIHHGSDSNQNIVPEHILERDRKQEAYERGFKDPPSHPHRRLTTFETEEFCERSTKILKKKRSDPKQNCSSKTCPNKLSPLVCPISTTPICSRNSSNMSNFMSPLPTPANADQKSSIVGGKTVTTSTETKITFSNEKLF